MDANTSVVLIALIGIIIPFLNWVQNRSVANKAEAKAKEVKDALETEGAKVKERLDVIAGQGDEIHKLVDGRLSEALSTIEELKELLSEVRRGKTGRNTARTKKALEKTV